MEKRIRKYGFLSYHQAEKIAIKNDIPFKNTIAKIFYRQERAAYVHFWNAGNITFINKMHLCPAGQNTVIAKRITKETSDKKQVLRTYKAKNNFDVNDVTSMLKRREYTRAYSFPPVEKEFYINSEDGVYILWSEEPDGLNPLPAADKDG